MRIHKITKYDEGQILIKASDSLIECSQELKQTQSEMSEKLRHMACEIGEIFEKHGSHQFDLIKLEDCGCTICKENK